MHSMQPAGIVRVVSHCSAEGVFEGPEIGPWYRRLSAGSWQRWSAGSTSGSGKPWPTSSKKTVSSADTSVGRLRLTDEERRRSAGPSSPQ
jgi:hypothetical protein